MKIKYLVAAVGFAFASTVCAEDADLNQQFMTLDANNDGFLSQSELSSSKELASRLQSLDTNKDGRIDKAEFAKLNSGTFVPNEEENEPIGAAPTK